MPSSTPHQKFCFYHLPTRGRAGIKLGDVDTIGNRSIILKFSYAHQDASMEYTSNEEKGVHLHTLVDRERKRSNERG